MVLTSVFLLTVTCKVTLQLVASEVEISRHSDFENRFEQFHERLSFEFLLQLVDWVELFGVKLEGFDGKKSSHHDEIGHRPGKSDSRNANKSDTTHYAFSLAVTIFSVSSSVNSRFSSTGNYSHCNCRPWLVRLELHSSVCH